MGSSNSSLEKEDDIFTRLKKVKEIKFYLQGEEHVANCEQINPNTTLNHYLRNITNMTGTKGMCFEGGCGACVVVLQNKDPITQKEVFLAVNSCLIPLLSCNGWRIYTIEGIGNPVQGYHPIQEVLAQFNGTQCGFCSPGMVMNMYALYKSGKLTMKEVENSFSGNLCRCTGYRPILSAFKSLCKDATPEILGECPDMEDFVVCYNEKCEKKCEDCPQIPKESFYLTFTDTKWIKVHTLKDLLQTLNVYSNLRYKLVAGNTAQGVFSSYKKEVDLYIDIMEVAELTVHNVTGNSCIVGANVTLTDVIEFFKNTSTNSSFQYLEAIADHIDLVANVPVRNRGTIAGNLIMKHDHHDFPSDIFLLLETVNAQLTIVNLAGQETKLTPLQFINFNMNKQKVILKSVTLSGYPSNVKFTSYKIMPRSQNVHAIVNAGFLFTFAETGLIKNARIVFGNINPTFVHATASENFLNGKNLFDNSVLKQVFQTLNQELTPDVIPPDPSPKCRKQLAISLFYKAVLSIAPADKLSPENKSGAELLKRPISTGAQDYETNKSMYPVTEAITKLEALAQTSGVAEYIADLPDVHNQLFGALVLAKAPPNSTIKNINPSKALSLPDIVAFYGKDDIPGDNIFTPISSLTTSEEELFCDGRVKFYEQPIGILVGKTQKSVDDAVDSIKVNYDPPTVEPLITIRQVIEKDRTDRIDEYKTLPASRKGNNVTHVIKGSFDIYHQYHFHMETQCCQAIPTENELDIYLSSQWMDLAQNAVARVLKVPQSKINIIVRRCGGAFGAKISRACIIACAAALAAWKLKKPVKLWLPLTTNMAAIGKRFPLSEDYEVGVDDKGYQYDEDTSEWMEKIYTTIYTSDTFTVHLNRVTTDTHCNTWMRAPGSTEGLAALEVIVEHICSELNLDQLDVRMANLSDKTPVAKYITDVKTWANIDQRRSEIQSFNNSNRWKKKGLSVVPMSFDMILIGPYLVTVSIFNSDGSVQISHGGTEVGQGINTKAAQICAYKFGIPMNKIVVLPSNTFVSANSTATGSSITSDGVCYGVIQACDQLLARIKPYQGENVTWEDAVNKCQENYVNLVATGLYSPEANDVHPYSVYGVCATEVLVDILTGQHLVTRVDLIEDTGTTLNPIIDIGQAEGAFVMGLGYYTTEKIVFNYEGKILTNNTWTYHVPGAKDIPVNFNVKFPKNNPNPVGVLKSKGTGEPAMSLGITVPFAIRNALASARKDANPSSKKWFPINGTTDVENVLDNTLNDPSQYIL